MAFQYLMLFFQDEPAQPRGLCMWQRTSERLDMIAWDWSQRTWREAPDIVMPILAGQADYEEKQISRAEAERIAQQLDIVAVPTEDQAMAIVDAAEAARQRARGS